MSGNVSAPDTALASHVVLPADLVRLVDVTDPAVAPDGQTVACVVTRIDVDANAYRSAIWLVDADGATTPRQLTSGAAADSAPRWSPDGGRVAFVRKEEVDGKERSTLLVMPVDGPGEPVPVAEGAESIKDPQWSPDGQQLAWAARLPDPESGPDRDHGPRRIEVLFNRLDGTGWLVGRWSQVFLARADGLEPVRQLTEGPYDHGGVRWSPDGTRLVLTAARHEGWDLDRLNDLWALDVESGELNRLTEGAGLAWSNPSWSPAGDRIAAVAVDPSTGFRNPDVVVVDVASGAIVNVTKGLDRNFDAYPGARPPVWLDDDALLASREESGRVEVVRLSSREAAGAPVVAGGDRVIAGFDAAGSTLAIVSTTTSTLPELSVAGLDGAGEAGRTAFGAPFLRACPPHPVERFTFPSPAGDTDLDAWFVRPDGFGDDGDDRRWPLLVSVHGGPMTQYGDRWFDEFQLWASAGFAVVGCNPHGASGRDTAFARSIRSPLASVDPGTGWGGIDADDVLACLDATLEGWPALDGTRVGLLGGSYGGFMTSWLLGHSDRFAAGCSERAVNNLLSEEWSADCGGTFHFELGVSHLEHPEEYLRMSPAMYADAITAAVLILHSENDLRCNIEQGDALFVALRLLRRDVEYWRFPGEGHELSRSGAPKHRIRRAELILDFFERRLKS